MTAPIRILLLEDTATDAELILRELKRASLDVTARRVDSEAQFRQHLLGSYVDIILADYSLPGFSGARALEIARDLAPDVPFIFVSGSIGEERAIEALNNGAMDYILKDRLARLAPAVVRALDDRRERTLRLAAQNALRLSSQRFEYAAKATSDGLWDWDLELNRFWATDTLNAFVGAPEGIEHEMEGWLGLIHADDRDAIATSLGDLASGGGPQWKREFRIQRANGEFAYVSGRAHVVHDRDGIPIRVIGAIEDITARRQSEEAVRESESRFRSVAESAADGILLTNADCTIMLANEQSARLFGLTATELVGRGMLSLMPERFREKHMRDIEPLRAGSRRQVMEIVGLRGDGTEFPLEMSISAWMSGGHLFFTKIVRDITARVAAERQQETRFTITRLLAESANVPETVPEVMRAIAEGMGWFAAVAWLADTASPSRLTCAGAGICDDDAEPIRTASLARVFESGQGLVGRACAAREPLSRGIEEMVDDPRWSTLIAAGVSRGMAIPLYVGTACVGAIELFERASAHPDATVVDITRDIAWQIAQYLERTRSDDERNAVMARLREAQQLAHIGSWDHDVQRDIVVWSEEVYAIFGVDSATFVPSFQAYLSFIVPEERERITALLIAQQADRECRPVFYEHQIDRPDGTRRFLECRSYVSVDEQGRFVRAIGTLQDVTERALARQTIDGLRRRNQLILDSAAEGIVGCDTRGVMTFANPAAIAMLGWPEAELFDGRDTHSRIHHTKADGSPYPADECAVLATARDGKKRAVTNEVFWRATGDPFDVEYQSAPIIRDGIIEGTVLTFRDVTQSRTLERQIAAINRVDSLGRVAATVAHEFNNVLMGIDPFAEVIRRRSKRDPRFVEPADHISNSVRRGRRITEAILRFTRPAPPVVHAQACGQWLRALLPELRVLAGDDVTVDAQLPEIELFSAFDSAQMQQILTNLVVNARDAMPNDGRLSIALSQRDAQLQLVVSDSGPGIPPHAMKHIFEPLFTTKRSGTGLGLAVARQIITMHGGSIDAANLEGGGAIFTILLPLLPTQALPSGGVRTESERPMDHDQPMNVLLVEDDEAISSGMAELLRDEGISLRIADRGEYVMTMVEQQMPDVVVLDLTLPDTAGATLFRELRERWPLLPVVFSTGHAAENDLTAELQQERIGFLRKPYAISELLTILRQLREPLADTG